MINNNDIMTISLNHNLPSEFIPASKFMFLNNSIPLGVEIYAEPIDPNKKFPIILGTLISISNSHLYSKLILKVRLHSGFYRSFLPIHYNLLYRHKFKQHKSSITADNKRASMISLLTLLDHF